MKKSQPVLSPRRLAACRANIRKAHEANRRNPLSPARREALRKATEANRRNFRLTPARRAAMSGNIRKAQAASVRRFRMTPARRRANLANIRKAIAAPRTPESRARSRFNRLKHGLQARSFEQTLGPFGEHAAEFQAHRAAMERTLAPQDDDERALVERISEAIWLRLRIYRAQARWVAARLKRCLRTQPFVENPDTETTEQRAREIMAALLDDAWVIPLDNRILRRIERRLRALVRKRKGDDAALALFTATPEEKPDDLQTMEQDFKLWERLVEGGREVDAALEELRPPLPRRPG